jgi:hypothetical protein
MLQLKTLNWEKNTLIQRRYANGGSVRGVGLLAVLVFDNIPCREAAPIPPSSRPAKELGGGCCAHSNRRYFIMRGRGPVWMCAIRCTAREIDYNMYFAAV